MRRRLSSVASPSASTFWSARLSTVRLISAEDGRTMLDLLFASSGIEHELAEQLERWGVQGR